jgi:hypothetical protein
MFRGYNFLRVTGLVSGRIKLQVHLALTLLFPILALLPTIIATHVH